MKHSYRVQILEHHLDSFGHVNNAVYMQLFEQARWDLITARGFGSDTIAELKQGPVILDAHIQYRKELRNREWITIESEIVPSEKPLIFNIHQVMVKEDGKAASIADFSGGLMDLVERKLMKPTPRWLKVFS
jgi:acyl-CoA thioester hydrolase